MWSRILVVYLIGAALAGVPRFPNTSTLPLGRIVGGNDSYIEDFPYQVSVRYVSSHRCGGGILNVNTIITAGHCVNGLTATRFSIRVGSSFKSSGGQIISVSEAILHEDYDDEDQDNDIALLKLDENLIYGDGIQPIALPPADLDLAAGTATLLAGWGRLEYQGASPDQLQSVILPIVDRDICAEVYLPWTTVGVGERQICAGEKGRDACQGDSGGPLVYNGMVIGLVSWGNECALADYPSVFARVGSHLDWLANHLE